MLRSFVILSGLCLVAAGVALILSLPVALFPRILAAAAWLGFGAFDIERQRRAYGRYRGISLDCEGRLALRTRRGTWLSAELLPGSLVLRHIGWIRIRDERGSVFAEPVRGHCRASRDWRRLQVLWRHVGAHP